MPNGRGQRWLTPERKETVPRTPRPQSRRQVREFLGSAGFYRLGIPGFAERAEPLYLATKDRQPFQWTEEAEQAFQQIKTALLSAWHWDSRCLQDFSAVCGRKLRES